MASLHHAYHYTGYYQFVAPQSDPSLRKLYGQMARSAEDQLWYDKLREVIDAYQPDILWQDFNLGAIPESDVLEPADDSDRAHVRYRAAC